jgi:hypothetical protein
MFIIEKTHAIYILPENNDWIEISFGNYGLKKEGHSKSKPLNQINLRTTVKTSRLRRNLSFLVILNYFRIY